MNIAFIAIRKGVPTQQRKKSARGAHTIGKNKDGAGFYSSPHLLHLLRN